MLRYKACRKSIVTLELLDDSKTNEKRLVVDKNYAKFRCDKAKVVNIVNVKTGEKMVEDVSIHNSSFEYTLGEIVMPDYFNTDINKVCARGIHYFKTKEAALSWFYKQDNGFPDGKWTGFHDNGRKYYEGTFKNAKKDGKWIRWHDNGQKGSEGTYKDGKVNDKWIYWWSNGTKRSEGTYKDGKLDGKWIRWHENGQIKLKGTFKDGKIRGRYVLLDEDGWKVE